jgi:hypothetical protein
MNVRNTKGPIISSTRSMTEPTGAERVREYCPPDVQRLFEEHYNNIFATGERDYRECDICEAIEKVVKMYGHEIDYRFDQISPNVITIPSINAPEGDEDA